MSNRRPAKQPSGLRAALAARKSRVEKYGVALVDSEVADAAAEAFNLATERLGFATFSKDTELAKKATTELEAARAELGKCFYWLTFKGLPEPDFDALVNEHPPSDSQRAKGETWNIDTFPYALLVACIQGDNDLTAEEWKAELESPNWTRADRAALLRKVYDANQREFSAGIPKG